MSEFLLLANDNGLAAAASVCVIVALLLLLFLVMQRGRYRAPGPGKRDDFAKMLILFQTMRDLLEEQKALARELNEAIDTKVKFVRERVEAAQIDLANMRTEVEELSAAIDTHRNADVPKRADESSATPGARCELEALIPKPNREDSSPEDRLRLLALPEQDSKGADRLDSWVGLDLGNQPDTVTPDEQPELDLEAPADPESAREAFKSLLSQDALPRLGRKELASSNAPASPTNPNGEGRITPAIKGRVFEYSTAGMTISQIAKELGIGKGEVRLILSLRDIQGS
jgi:hypothetical protein